MTLKLKILEHIAIIKSRNLRDYRRKSFYEIIELWDRETETEEFILHLLENLLKEHFEELE